MFLVCWLVQFTKNETIGVNPNRKSSMSLISAGVTLAAMGVLVWLVNARIPMDGRIKKAINILLAIGAMIWLLSSSCILEHTLSHLWIDFR